MPAIFEEVDGTWRVEVDATEAEDHQANAIVTTHAVERGANIADHVIHANPFVNLDVIVTDQPVIVPGTQNDGVVRESRDVVQVNHVTTSPEGEEQSREVRTYQGLVLSGPLRRVIGVHQAFLEQWRRASLIQVETSLAIYGSCILRSVGVPRRKHTAVTFRVMVEQVRFADTETVEALPQKAEKPNGKPKVNLGNKPPKQERIDDAEADQSLASKSTGIG